MEAHCAEDVVIVGNCGYKLQHKATPSAHVIATRPVLNVLPGCASVLLVHADRLLHNNWLPCFAGAQSDSERMGRSEQFAVADHDSNAHTSLINLLSVLEAPISLLHCRQKMQIHTSTKEAPFLSHRTASKYLMTPRQSQPRSRLEQQLPMP